MEHVKNKPAGIARSRTRAIAFVALTIAIMAVSAWVAIPLGPVPFTLQIFAVAFALLVLQPREAIAAVAGYLVLGAIGLPVFSAMRGGIGVLAGPSGGFLWGYLLGVGLALVVRMALMSLVVGKGAASAAGASQAVAAGASQAKLFAVDLASGLVFLAVAYICGWAQLMAVAGMSPEAAFASGVAPFVIVDVIKLVAAVLCARAVKRAVPRA